MPLTPSASDADPYHPEDCGCGRCSHPWPGDALLRRFSRVTWAAITLGLALILAVDRVTCGPGILCIFGY